MSAPRRIQQRRTAGWRKPEGAVSVARGKGRRWGNPYVLPPGATEDDHRLVVALYSAALLAGRLAVTTADARRELAGRDLMCWCPPGWPCHADVLLDIANDKETTVPIKPMTPDELFLCWPLAEQRLIRRTASYVTTLSLEQQVELETSERQLTITDGDPPVVHVSYVLPAGTVPLMHFDATTIGLHVIDGEFVYVDD